MSTQTSAPLVNEVVMRKALQALLILSALAIAAPQAEEKLAVVNVLLHQTEDGAVAQSTYPFLPGETVYFSCQIAGFQRVERHVDQQEMYLTYSIEVRDAHDVPVVPDVSDKIATLLSPEDKHWLPKIREAIMAPPLAGSGEYRIVVKVRDEYGKTETQAVAKFTIKGRDVAPSDTLVVRNFRFLRNEDDRDALEVAAYRPGDTVWARFDMTGYKLGDRNQFDIEYGLQVIAADGAVSYSNPQAAEKKDETFYPQAWAPGTLSLVLPKDVKLGAYTIVLTIKDDLGNQTYETRGKFSVE
jgi:hypothetical protein